MNSLRVQPSKPPKHSHNHPESKQQEGESTNIRRLSSFTQLTRAFNPRHSRVNEEIEEFAHFDAVATAHPKSPAAKGAEPAILPREIPNFSLPGSAQKGRKYESQMASSFLSYDLLPRSSTFSHLPSINKHDDFPAQLPPSLVKSRSTQTSISSQSKPTSPQRSFLPIRVSPQRRFAPATTCPSPQLKTHGQHDELCFKEAQYSFLMDDYINDYRFFHQLNNQSGSTVMNGVTWAARINDSLNFKSPSEIHGRYETAFNSSAYWTGRFTALNDIYLNTSWCDPKLFNIDSYQASHALDVERSRAVFAALEELCVTSEAKDDLNLCQQFRQQYARIRNIPELITEVAAPTEILNDLQTQRAALESSSETNHGIGLGIDLDEAFAPSSVSTASNKNNPKSFDFALPPDTPHREELSAVPTEPSVQCDFWSPNHHSSQSPRQLQKSRRASFIEKLLGKSKRSSIIEV